jgi:hypothetical protein
MGGELMWLVALKVLRELYRHLPRRPIAHIGQSSETTEVTITVRRRKDFRAASTPGQKVGKASS